jgi:hypothetical protein
MGALTNSSSLAVANGDTIVDVSGNLYMVSRSSVDNTTLGVWKSTDDGGTWTEQDTADRPTGVTNTIEAYAWKQDTTTIHVIYGCSTGSGKTTAGEFRYSWFDMSTDAWSDTVDEQIEAPGWGDTQTSTVGQVDIALRSNNDVLAMYRIADYKDMGTPYISYGVNVRNATSWQGATAAEQASTNQGTRVGIVCLLSEAYLFWQAGSTSRGNDFSSTNNMGTAATITNATTGNATKIKLANGRVGWTTTNDYLHNISSGSFPGAGDNEQFDVSPAGANGRTNLYYDSITTATDSMYVLYTDSNSDIYINNVNGNNTSSSNFSATSTEVLDSVVAIQTAPIIYEQVSTPDNLRIIGGMYYPIGGQPTWFQHTLETVTSTKLDINHYRWYDDRPDQGGVAQAAEDTKIDITDDTVETDLCMVLRISTNTDGVTGPINITGTLQYRVNAGSWNTMNSTSGVNVWHSTIGGDFSSPTSGEYVLTAVGGGRSVQTPGDFWSSIDYTGIDAVNDDSELEHWFGITIDPADFTAGDTIEFQYADADQVASPTVLPRIDITAGTGEQFLTPSLFNTELDFNSGEHSVIQEQFLTPTLYSLAPSYPTATVIQKQFLTPSLLNLGFSVPTQQIDEGNYNITASLLSLPLSFPTATVTAGNVDIVPALLDISLNFIQASIANDSGPEQFLTPTLYDLNFTVPTQQIDEGNVNVSASLYDIGLAFPTATVTPGAYDLTPSLYDLTLVISPDTVDTSYTLTATLFDLGLTFDTATIVQEQFLTPSLLDLGFSIFTAQIDEGNVDLTASLYDLGMTFPQASIIIEQFLEPALLDLAFTYNLHTIDAGDKFLAANLFDMSLTPTAGTVTYTYDLTPSLLDLGLSFGTATVSATYDINPTLLDLSPTYGTSSVDATYVINPTLFDLSVTFETPTITATYDLTPSLLDLGPSYPTATIQLGAQPLTASLFDMSLSFPANPDIVPEQFVQPDTYPFIMVFGNGLIVRGDGIIALKNEILGIFREMCADRGYPTDRDFLESLNLLCQTTGRDIGTALESAGATSNEFVGGINSLAGTVNLEALGAVRAWALSGNF